MVRSSVLLHRWVHQARELMLEVENGATEAAGMIAPGKGRKSEIGEEVVEVIVTRMVHSGPEDGPS